MDDWRNQRNTAFSLGNSKNHLIREDQRYIADPYNDDLSLVLEVDEGLAVICGCCRGGLLNTLEHIHHTLRIPLCSSAGGTHLGSADDTTLEAIARLIGDWGKIRRIYLNHCSGEHAYTVLKQRLEENVVQHCPAGTKINIEEVIRH